MKFELLEWKEGFSGLKFSVPFGDGGNLSPSGEVNPVRKGRKDENKGDVVHIIHKWIYVGCGS